MKRLRNAFADNAEALTGTKFRLGGRDPRFGIDCVGLVACSLKRAGIRLPPIPQYRLRNTDYSFIQSLSNDAGFVRADTQIERGDVVLVKPGPAQRHLLVALGMGRFVHAHAGLGRVVQSGGLIPWAILENFRLTESA